MEIPKFKVICFIKKYRINQKGKAPLYFRIMINDEKMEISTNKFIVPENWDKKKEVARNTETDTTINPIIEKLRSEINKAISQIIISDADLNTENLKKLLNGEAVMKTYRLIEKTIEHNDQFEKQIGIKYSYGSYKNYKTTLKFLKEFLREVYKKNDLPLKEINVKFCENFFIWLTKVKTCKQNGANKHIQRIKKIINYSIKMGYIQKNATQAYSLTFRSPYREALTWEEVELIQKLSLKNPRLEHIKNIILFQIYTGLSYADIKTFCKKHIYKGIDGNIWLKMERMKTHNTFAVPILKPAQMVLDKYLDTLTNPEDAIFPVLSNQKMNDNLKIIQEIAGISKNLHTHLFRHTFASTITLQSGVPLETVSKMLGHSKIAMTQIYARVGELKIAADMKSLSDYLN
jgi:site-specific recombinase XerD